MTETEEKLGTFPYVIGGLSFIPGIGFIFGAIAITWGLVTNKAGGKKLAKLGALGIGFGILLYGALFYFGFMQRGGVYDDLRARLAQTNLTQLVQSIEFYKLQNGQYPEDLDILRESLPKESLVFIYDSTQVGFGSELQLFYYELIDTEEYYLLGIGSDNTPFTQDDILPAIENTAGIGLRVRELNE
jgi:hypothetical protein